MGRGGLESETAADGVEDVGGLFSDGRWNGVDDFIDGGGLESGREIFFGILNGAAQSDGCPDVAFVGGDENGFTCSGNQADGFGRGADVEVPGEDVGLGGKTAEDFKELLGLENKVGHGKGGRLPINDGGGFFQADASEFLGLGEERNGIENGQRFDATVLQADGSDDAETIVNTSCAGDFEFASGVAREPRFPIAGQKLGDVDALEGDVDVDGFAASKFDFPAEIGCALAGITKAGFGEEKVGSVESDEGGIDGHGRKTGMVEGSAFEVERPSVAVGCGSYFGVLDRGQILCIDGPGERSLATDDSPDFNFSREEGEEGGRWEIDRRCGDWRWKSAWWKRGRRTEVERGLIDGDFWNVPSAAKERA